MQDIGQFVENVGAKGCVRVDMHKQGKDMVEIMTRRWKRHWRVVHSSEVRLAGGAASIPQRMLVTSSASS